MSGRARRHSKWLSLPFFERFEEAAWLATRLATGVFLVYGVWDNIVEPARMREFVEFMRSFAFPAPEFWAPFSVYTQLIAGLLILPGLLTRWAGAIIAATFAVALVMVHWEQTLREWWPALSLLVIGLLLMTRGGGRFSLDARLFRRR